MTVNYKMRKIGIIAIPILFIFFMLSIAGALYVAAASTIVVNGTCIQEAVNMAEDGDEIIVYPGVYRENVIVDKPVGIRSFAGAQDTVIEAQYRHLSIFHITANHVNISGFTVGSTKKPGLNGIYLDRVRDCNIFNNSIKFNYKNAIYSHYSSYSVIEDNIMNFNEEHGIYLFNSSENIIKNNTANSNKGHGLDLIESNNNTLKNNVVNLNEIDGIALFSSNSNIVGNNTANFNRDDGAEFIESDSNSIENNIALNNYGGANSGGFILISSNNNTVDNNIASNNSYNGICLTSSINNIIEKNIALNNSYGIWLYDLSKNIIKNNTANSNEIDGIALESSYDNIVENNTATLNKGNGVYLTESNNDTIKNNVVNSNEEIGIYLYLLNNNTVKNNIALNNTVGMGLQQSSKNIIENNMVDSNELGGIALWSSYDNIVENNTATLNKGDGVYLIESDNNTIKNNVVNSNEIDGIALESSYDNIVENNTANLNKDDGVDLMESCNNTIKKNNAKSNEYYGIYLDSSFCNTIKDNTASNNRYGIYLNFSFNNIIKNNIAKSNNEDGFSLYSSSYNNTIEKNIALDNGYGIYMSSSFNNIIKSNVLNSNNKYGSYLFSTDNNTIEKNIISNNYGGSNYGGIYLGSSFNNIIRENIINSNSLNGILLDSLSNNVLVSNTISLNDVGAYFTNSTENTIYHNNLVNNSIIQAFDDSPRENNWFHRELVAGNHWSDYNGTDNDGDGIGDTGIPHPGDAYDWYPFIEKNGWRTFLISPEYWDFDTVYQGRSKNVTFVIQNRGVHDLTILSISADPNIIISDIEPSMKITKGDSKTFNVTIDATNLEGDVLKSVEIMSDDKITPNKTILIYGFVKPPIHDVRITAIDFDSRIIKGQIDMFNVSLSNHGSYDEYNISVEFKDGAELLGNCTIPVLLAGENETVSYHWDTKDAASGVHEIAIEVRLPSKDLLDGIKVKVNVLSSSEASTLIVTNFERMSELWGENETTKLEEKLIVLSYSPCVNGIIIRVEEDKNCADAYELWKSDSLSPEKANTVARAIKQVIESKQKEYTNVEYIILVGDDRVIPFYRLTDNSDRSYIGVLAWPTEDEYAKDLRTANTTISSALGENMMLTDDFYVDFNPEDAPVGWGGVLHIPDMPVGRLVESPEEICLTIETFIDRGDSVRPDKIFVTAYDFMNDSGCNCARALETLTSPLVMSKGNRRSRATYNSSSEILDELLTNRSDIIAIFQHADHSQFILYRVSGDDESISVTSTDISNASVDLNGAIVYTMGCHSGLNVPQDDENDLVDAFISKKVLAYVAPTGYGIGSEISVAGHEKLLYYFTKYLCEGVDVGTALMYAKQDYYALEFDFDHIDGKVASTMIVYGLPMYRVNIEKLEKAEYITTKSVSSLGVSDKKGKIEVATLTLRPSYSLVEAELGNYYYSEDYQSDSGKPIQPKVTWSYIVRDKKMLHGMVLKSASYKDEKNFNPVIDSFVVSPTAGYKRIGFDAKNWYPSIFFKINTVGDKQFLIIISGQYNPRKCVERLYNETTFDIYISAENEENPRPPEIIGVHAIRSENTTNIRVNASDESGIYRVFIAYTDVKGEWDEWRSKCLKRTGEGLWSCNILTGEEIEFFVQAVDVYGNVAVDDNEGEYYPEKDGGPGPS